MDTCSSCEKLAADIRAVDQSMKCSPENSTAKAEAEKKLKAFKNEKQLHLKKANMFYVRKRTSKRKKQGIKRNHYHGLSKEFSCSQHHHQ